MSLIQVVITDNFILAGADTRSVRCDNNAVISEKINKLIKLNKGIIFGCTGGVLDNYELFYEFCSYDSVVGYSNLPYEFSLSYNEFVEIISKRFEIMKCEHNDEKADKKYDIGAVIAGHNGTQFEATCFNLGGRHGQPDGIVKVKKAIDFPYKGVNLGEKMHMDELHELVDIQYHKYGNLTIRQYMNIMHEVFDKGIIFNTGINNNIHFEKIRKKDIL